jgi:hypothetical protein
VYFYQVSVPYGTSPIAIQLQRRFHSVEIGAFAWNLRFQNHVEDYYNRASCSVFDCVRALSMLLLSCTCVHVQVPSDSTVLH